METERKRNRERDNNDRISNLPEFLIHQILSYLPPKEAARTTALSKTWLQSYSTSPILTFNERFFFFRSPEIVESRYPFFNFVNNTLLRYTRLNLRIHKLQITVFRVNHEPAYRLLDESLGVAFHNGVQQLNITVFEPLHSLPPYTLPSAMFDSPKLLTYLRLDRCKFPECIVSNSKCNAISFPFLKTLNLCRSYINDDMLQKLLSGTPSLEKIVFFKVFWLTKIRVTNLGELKILDINCWRAFVIDVEDAPSLRLLKCWGSFKSEKPCLLKVGSSLQSLNLKRLELGSVSISDNSLKDLIAKSPLLEDLLIYSCDELERVYILSSSLKHLDFKQCKMLVEARIEAPNLLELHYYSKNMLSLFLNNTPDKLKTFIHIDHFEHGRLNNAWFKQLREGLKAINQARVLFRLQSLNQGIEFGITHDARENPLPLEHQPENFMPHVNQASSVFAVFVETLFSSSRPTRIDTRLRMSNNVKFVKFLNNELMTVTRHPNCCSSDQTKCWRHYLKDIKAEVEAYEDSQKVWQPLLHQSSLSDFTCSGQGIRFGLKWYANLNAEV